MRMRDTMIVQFIQDRLDPGLGLSTSILCNAHNAAMRRQAQQVGTKTGGLREVYGDNIMPTQLTLNHNPRATASRREAADPIEGNEFGIASIAGLPARIPNRSRQMGTHNF